MRLGFTRNKNLVAIDAMRKIATVAFRQSSVCEDATPEPELQIVNQRFETRSVPHIFNMLANASTR